MPSPSSSTSARSTPGHAENAPSRSISAIDTRTANASPPAWGGQVAISAVAPPPLRHGMRRKSRGESSRELVIVGREPATQAGARVGALYAIVVRALPPLTGAARL